MLKQLLDQVVHPSPTGSEQNKFAWCGPRSCPRPGDFPYRPDNTMTIIYGQLSAEAWEVEWGFPGVGRG